MQEQDASAGEHLSIHRPVMGEEVLEVLDPRPGSTLLDLTVGTGGHSLVTGRRLGPDGLVVGMDADAKALARAGRRLGAGLDCRVRLFHGRFSEAGDVLKEVGLEGFDMILADLGVGTHQLDDPDRGFSFAAGGELDMRFDPSRGRSAGEVLNGEPEKVLADIFYSLGGERFSRQIAAEVCRRRRSGPLAGAKELSDIAKRVYAARGGGRRRRLHPATRIFMALRIYVNDELDELDRLLDILPELAASGARAAVITYHSLEAGRVKRTWRRQKSEGKLELITPKPLKPAEAEVSENPRARSAQLRAARFRRKSSVNHVA